MNKAAVVLVIVILAGSYQAWNQREVERPAGVLVTQEPLQKEAPSEAKPIRYKDTVLDPLAEFSLKARVLSTHRYWFDKLAPFIPVDVAFGWGPMSDSDVLKRLKLWQEDRFYFYTWREELPYEGHVLGLHSANMHLIPANEYIESEIKKLRKGQLVDLKGYLVRMNFPDGSDAKSSLSRSDSGAGACEIIYVESLQVY